MSETAVPYLVTTDRADTAAAYDARRAIPLTVPLAQVHLSPRNTRKIIPQKELRELAASMGQHGQLTRCLGRPMPCPEGHDASVPHYELAAGHRRTLAALLLGWSHIDVDVREMDDHAFLMALWTENLQRTDVPPLEEARGIQDLIEAGWDVAAIAFEIGRPEQFVRGRLLLLSTTDEVQEAMLRGLVPVTHAMELAKLTPEYQREALTEIFGLDVLALADAALARAEDRQWEGDEADEEFQWGGDARLDHVPNPFARYDNVTPRAPSLADLRAELRQRFYRRLSVVPWDVTDAKLVPGAGSCAACEKRSGHAPSLFPELSETTGEVCLDSACFAVKTKAHEKRVKAAERKAAKQAGGDAPDGYEADASSSGGDHRPNNSRTEWEAKQQREAQKTARQIQIVQAGRSAALRELVSAVTLDETPLLGTLRTVLLSVLERAVDNLDKDDVELLRIMHGSSYDEVERTWDWQHKALEAWITDEERTAVQLLRLAVLLTCQMEGEVQVNSYHLHVAKHRMPKTLAAFAEVLGVDLRPTMERVEQEAAARLKAEEKAAALEAKRAARAAEKAAKKGTVASDSTKPKRGRRPAKASKASTDVAADHASTSHAA